MVLLLEAVLRIGAQPKFWQRTALFEAVAAIIVGGMCAGLHLLSRSWRDLQSDSLRDHVEPDTLQQPGSADGGGGGGRQQGRRHAAARQSSFGTSLYMEQQQQQAQQPLQSVLVHDYEPLTAGCGCTCHLYQQHQASDLFPGLT